jgi:hypothetical protein
MILRYWDDIAQSVMGNPSKEFRKAVMSRPLFMSEEDLGKLDIMQLGIYVTYLGDLLVSVKDLMDKEPAYCVVGVFHSKRIAEESRKLEKFLADKLKKWEVMN